MAIKNLLHLNKVKDFEKWMESQGWIAIECKGEYEILRMIKHLEKQVIIYSGGNPEHASFEDRLFPIVARFIKENRQREVPE